MVGVIKICDCGEKYFGHPSARRCPTCRDKREQERRRERKRKKNEMR